MRIKNIIMSVALLAGCLTASAQQAATAPSEAFNPHWYVQAQGGAQYTLGEVCFGDLISGTAQIAGGYNFTPVWGVRLAVNAWQSKGGTHLDYLELGDKTWKYNYVAPTVDVVCDLSNWILGYKAKRVCNFGVLAGIGANIGFGNGEACDVRNQIIAASNNVLDEAHLMSLYWCGTKARVVGKFGAFVDFNLSRRVSLGVEVNCNPTTDSYNSKKAGNGDWYFNALAGVKVRLGKVTREGQPVATPAPVVVEKVVEKIVEKPVEKIVYKEAPAAKREPLRRDIFFNIRGSHVSKTEMPKVEDVVAYLNKYPEAKVSVTGYADKGTGNPKINVGYAQKRAQMVADLLVDKYGISRSRITVDSKGDTVQPYEQNDLNRVSICVAE